MAVEVPQTLEYRSGQLNAAPLLEVENFTNWKKRFMCHIIGIEPQFKNILENGPCIPMTADKRKPEGQWTPNERKAANLDQRLKSLIMFVLPNDQMNFVINCLTTKSTWDDLILYHEGPSDDFQDSLDDKEDTRSSQEYMDDLEEEYQARALLAKSKTFFKKELRPTKYIKAKYNNVKVKLALLSSSTLASKASMVKNKGLIAQAYEWDEGEVSSDDNEMVEVKLLMALVEDNEAVKNEGFILPNHDTGRILPAESQRNITDPPVAATDSSAFDYDSADEFLFLNSTFKAEALKGVTINEPSSAPAKGNKSALASKVNSAPAGKLNNVKIKDNPPLAICERTDHRTYDHAEYMSTMNMSQHLKGQGGSSSRSRIPRPSKHFFPPCIHYRIIFLRRGIKPRNPQHVMKSCETCGSTVHTTTDHNDIEWFRRGKALQDKKVEALKSTKAESSDANRSKTPTKSGCSRHMTSVKSYLHKYVEQPGPKVVFGDDSTCTTEGYGSIKCNGVVFTKVSFVNGLKYNLITISQLCDAKYIVQFDEKRGTIFNSNKEVVMIALRIIDVYVLDMRSSAQESCFFAKAFENLNWLWHKRLAHLNFKTINQLTKENLIIGLPSLVYSKDNPCSSCEKRKHHRANFKTKQTSSIKKCLHLIHMDLFGPVTPRSINHEKYTLVIVDEYSRYTWVYFLKKKSQAPETIMSFIKRVKNQNDIKVKQLRTDNGTEFRNSILVNFCDEKGISQNLSSPYTLIKMMMLKGKNKTLIEAARTMLSGSVFSKQYWTEVVATACYTQNRYTTVKRHLKTPYEIFHKRIPSIDFLYVFGCPIYIHNHKDHLGKFEEKADDGTSLDTYLFPKPSKYPPDEYLYPYKPSQRYQTNSKDVTFIEPYECPELVVLETKVQSNQNGQADQNDHNDQNDQSVQTNEILNDDQSDYSNHTNDEQIIDNLLSTKDIQISEHLSSLNV
ncbi:retrovirus-related pol polyprotein from transposon TNT 1-94 [Tanacetum coccineum]